jgi:hypothetical protein
MIYNGREVNWPLSCTITGISRERQGMERSVFQLLKPLKVIQLGPQGETPLVELPKGAEVRVLRQSQNGDCIDIACEGERYFALRHQLFGSLED